MTQQKLTYTKAIKGGKLKLTEMEQGASVRGAVTALPEGKYGANLVLSINGKDVTIFPAGNVKTAIKKGEIAVGQTVTLTRKPDESFQAKDGSTATVTAFNIVKESGLTNSDTQAKIAAMRAGTKN